jgi:hypothetical protein
LQQQSALKKLQAGHFTRTFVEAINAERREGRASSAGLYGLPNIVKRAVRLVGAHIHTTAMDSKFRHAGRTGRGEGGVSVSAAVSAAAIIMRHHHHHQHAVQARVHPTESSPAPAPEPTGLSTGSRTKKIVVDEYDEDALLKELDAAVMPESTWLGDHADAFVASSFVIAAASVVLNIAAHMWKALENGRSEMPRRAMGGKGEQEESSAYGSLPPPTWVERPDV